MTLVVAKGSRWLFLDAIRGIAALAVVLQHVLWYLSPHFENAFSTIWSPGRFGVVAFFIVSGFIVPRSLEQRGDVKGFWISRFWRLFPAYWFSLLFIAILGAAGVDMHSAGDPSKVSQWIANLSMLQGFVRVADFNPVAWTLGLEMVLYGAITVAFIKGFLSRTWAISLALLGILGGGSIILPVFFHMRFPAGAAAVFGSIIAGLALYRWFSGSLSKKEAVAINLLCVLVTVSSSMVNYSPTRLASDPLQPTQFCAIFSAITGYAFFLGMIALRDRKFPKWTLWLGKISYSLYLLHPIALAVIPNNGNTVVTGALQLGLSLALAWFGYECIEVPCLEMAKRRFAKFTHNLTVDASTDHPKAA